ncbi:MAG: hypothetical protein CM15mV141_190 [uncultured marine virus]|nr:MAG: hypothetical protein CM15mV141_190 [uncultured marine virus]
MVVQVLTPLMVLPTFLCLTVRQMLIFTDFGSGVNTEHKVIRRAIEFTLNGFWLEDDSTGDIDTGQEVIYDAGKYLIHLMFINFN